MADNESIIVEPPDDQASYPDVYLIQVGDEVRGGVEGSSNKQAIALAARTQWLRSILMTVVQQFSNLAAQSVIGPITEPGGFVGTSNNAMGVNVEVTFVTEDTYQIYINSTTSERTADVFIKQNSPTGQTSLRKIEFPLSLTKQALLDSPVSYDDTLEFEIWSELKGSEWRTRVLPGGKVYLWGKSL